MDLYITGCNFPAFPSAGNILDLSRGKNLQRKVERELLSPHLMSGSQMQKQGEQDRHGRGDWV